MAIVVEDEEETTIRREDREGTGENDSAVEKTGLFFDTLLSLICYFSKD